jgi:hypothetical protein
MAFELDAFNLPAIRHRLSEVLSQFIAILCGLDVKAKGKISINVPKKWVIIKVLKLTWLLPNIRRMMTAFFVCKLRRA